MKLEDVEKYEASLGLLTVGERGEQGTYIRAPGVLVAECHLLGDAALLAHSKNMLRPFVDALTTAARALNAGAEKFRQNCQGVDESIQLEALQICDEVLAKAKEVPGI